MQLMYHKDHHFKVCNSIIWVYSQSCAFVSTIKSQYFHYPIKQLPSHSPPSLAPDPDATNLFSVLVDLSILDISYKWNHTTCGLCGFFY